MHSTVYSCALLSASTANILSRADSNTSVVESGCVHDIRLRVYRLISAVCVMMSQYTSVGPGPITVP